MSRSRGAMSLTTCPSTMISPSSASSSPASNRSDVDLPHPDGPTRIMNSPSWMSRLRLSTATKLSNRLVTLVNVTEAIDFEIISHMTFARQLVDDLSWCWWTQPRATRIDNVLYVGGIASDGAVFAAAYDLAHGSCHRSILARLEPDDHNNPALLVVRGKPPIAFYSRHDEDDAVRMRIAECEDDITAWGDERELRFRGITTYAQVHAVGEQVHLF